jgi:hypothetical protein
MKGLRFTVPLVRLVVPLDSLQSQPSTDNFQTLPLKMSLQIIRIEKPLETLLPKPKASLRSRPEETPTQAPKKKISSPRKSSGAPDRKASSRRKKQ